MNRDGAMAAPAASLEDHNVAVLQWPEEAEREAELSRLGQPRLLLVAADAPPPQAWDPLTDWVRVPADHSDVWSRINVLACRSGMWRAPQGTVPG